MTAAITAPHIDWTSFLPFTVLTVGALLVLFVGLIGTDRFRRLAVPTLTVLTALVAVGALLNDWNHPTIVISGALRIDNLTVGLGILCLVGVISAVMLSFRTETEQGLGRGEFHSLLLFSALGMLTLLAANDLVTLFVGVELLSIPLYVLSAAELWRDRSLEAGLKYLIVGSVGSATLLYGLAFLYGATGSTALPQIGVVVSSGAPLEQTLFATGVALMIAGLGFKASAAPFHQWTPDVYEGAPTGVTSFMATATKAAAIGILIRILGGPLLPAIHDWSPIIATLAVLSIVIGNFGALGQDSVKRMLAWSSVAQVGYLLAAFVAADQLGVQALVFYMIVYAVMTLTGFAVVANNSRDWGEGERMGGFAGLGKRRPWLAGSMTVALISLAGLPPTDGFIGKLTIITVIIDGNWTWLGFVIVLGSLVSLVYYLRVIAIMWFKEPAEDAPARGGLAPEVLAAFVAVTTAILTVGMGMFPSWPLNRAAEIGEKIISPPR